MLSPVLLFLIGSTTVLYGSPAAFLTARRTTQDALAKFQDIAQDKFQDKLHIQSQAHSEIQQQMDQDYGEGGWLGEARRSSKPL